MQALVNPLTAKAKATINKFDFNEKLKKKMFETHVSIFE